MLTTGKDYVSTNEARNIRIEGNNVSLDIVLGYPAKSVIGEYSHPGDREAQNHSRELAT